ncbi:MAG: 20S proteasome subunit A/B [Nitrospiraceae bacterium]|nr:20S proteasome subunit A/B [Nitrospiraceae bacterium]
MFDEPYRWIDAIHQRRDYISAQLDRATPVLAVSVDEGIVLATFHRQTPKIFELYDRMVLAGVGHPADLESVRGHLLSMAHVEGFQRSPSDVTIERLALFGLAPRLKGAFEDVSVPPVILNVLLGEVGKNPTQDLLLQVSYDGNIFRSSSHTVLAADDDSRMKTTQLLSGLLPSCPTNLSAVLPVMGRVLFETLYSPEERGRDESGNLVDKDKAVECGEKILSERVWEGVLLDRQNPGRIRRLPADPGWFR